MRGLSIVQRDLPLTVRRDSLGVVDLGALQLVRVVDVESLPLRVEVDGGDGCFAVAVAGFLGAAEGQMRFGADRGGVDVNDAGVQVADGLERAIHVVRVDRGGEAVRHAIRNLYRFLEIRDRDHGHNGTEDFFLRDTHLRIAVAENGRLMEPAFRVGPIGQAMSAGEELRAFRLADLHVFHYGVELLLVYTWPHVDAGVEAVTDFQFLGARYEARNKFVVHRLVHSDAAGCGAALTGGAEAAPDSAVDGEIEVGIVHHDDDVLAAHLEAAMLEFGCAGFRDQAADGGRAGKADHRNLQMLGQGRAGVGPVAAHQVHYAFGNTGFGEDLHQIVGGERSVLSRLQHDGVAADQRGHDFPRRDGHGKIPRRDHAAGADRLANAHGKFIGEFGRRGLTEEAAAFAGHVVGHVDRFLHVAAGFREDLAHFARHVLCEGFLVLD